MYKFFLYAPRDSKIITKIIDAAAKAGAGTIGNYTHCAFVTEGYGTWLPQKGAKPVKGKIGTLSKEDEVRIEMECPKEKMRAVYNAIKEVHPYDKFAIDAVPMEIFE